MGSVLLMLTACGAEEDPEQPPPTTIDERGNSELQAISLKAKTDSGLDNFTLIENLTTTELTTLNEQVVADLEFTERFLETLGHTKIACTNAGGEVTVTGSITEGLILATEYKVEADDLDVTFSNCAGIMEDKDGDGVADDDSLPVGPDFDPIDFEYLNVDGGTVPVLYWGSVRFNVVTLATIVAVDDVKETVRWVFTFDEYFDGGLALTDGPKAYYFIIRNKFDGTDDTTAFGNGGIIYNSYDYSLNATMETRVCTFSEAKVNTTPPPILPWDCT
ncbi:MAG: hypothetical protein V3S64_13270 [bacterium]